MGRRCCEGKAWNKLESFVGREEQLWPDCGRPSNTSPRRPRRQSHPNLLLLGFRPKLLPFWDVASGGCKGVLRVGFQNDPRRPLVRRGVRDPPGLGSRVAPSRSRGLGAA